MNILSINVLSHFGKDPYCTALLKEKKGLNAFTSIIFFVWSLAIIKRHKEYQDVTYYPTI